MKTIKQNIQSWHEEGLQLSAQYKRNEARMVELLSNLYGSKGYLLRLRNINRVFHETGQYPEKNLYLQIPYK